MKIILLQSLKIVLRNKNKTLKRKSLILLPQTVPSIWWQSNVACKKRSMKSKARAAFSPLLLKRCMSRLGFEGRLTLTKILCQKSIIYV